MKIKVKEKTIYLHMKLEDERTDERRQESSGGARKTTPLRPGPDCGHTGRSEGVGEGR